MVLLIPHRSPPHSSLLSSSFLPVVLLIPHRCPPHSSSLSCPPHLLLLSACFVYYYRRVSFITISVRCLLLSACVVVYYRRCLVCVGGRVCFYSISMVLWFIKLELPALIVTMDLILVFIDYLLILLSIFYFTI